MIAFVGLVARGAWLMVTGQEEGAAKRRKGPGRKARRKKIVMLYSAISYVINMDLFMEIKL